MYSPSPKGINSKYGIFISISTFLHPFGLSDSQVSIQHLKMVHKKSAKIGSTTKDEAPTEENSSSSSSVTSSPRKAATDGGSKIVSPLIDDGGGNVLEPAELHHAPSGPIQTNVEDYPAITNFGELKYISFVETTKLWAIAGPIAFNILCNYGINSFTNIFVGHIGDLELSAVAISLSVISNFSFGFLVSS